MNKIRTFGSKCLFVNAHRYFSVSTTNNNTYSCKLLILGGGSGGCTMAAKFSRRLKTKDSVIVLEPSVHHYYQPLWTLVAAGVTPLPATRRDAKAVLPKDAKWIKDSAVAIDPKKCHVQTKEGHVINYEYLIVAVGLRNDYEKVPGLREGLEDKNLCVSSIYAPEYAEKTFLKLQKFEGGEAIFTYPDSLIKCPGAPQKIVYMTDAYLTKTNRRSKANLVYNTCLPVIFGVKKYADELVKVAERKNVKVNFQTLLKEVKADKCEAVFINKATQEECTAKYDFLHVAPPMRAPDLIYNNRDIANEQGLLEVDKFTLQHVKYANIYGIGDCTSTPNSKTGAAVAKQSWVLEQNLLSTMKKDNPKEQYDGYGACPLVTSYGKCIMAEFIYDGVVTETFPWNQAKESTLAYYMKRDLFPFIYWNFMLKGYYHGPGFVRKIVNPLGW